MLEFLFQLLMLKGELLPCYSASNSILILWMSICVYGNIYCTTFSLCTFSRIFVYLPHTQKLFPVFERERVTLWRIKLRGKKPQVKQWGESGDIARGQTQTLAVETEQKEFQRPFLHWYDEKKTRHKVCSGSFLWKKTFLGAWHCLLDNVCRMKIISRYLMELTIMSLRKCLNIYVSDTENKLLRK